MNVKPKPNQITPVAESFLPEIPPKRTTAVQMRIRDDGILSNDGAVLDEMSLIQSATGKSRLEMS